LANVWINFWEEIGNIDYYDFITKNPNPRTTLTYTNFMGSVQNPNTETYFSKKTKFANFFRNDYIEHLRKEDVIVIKSILTEFYESVQPALLVDPGSDRTIEIWEKLGLQKEKKIGIEINILDLMNPIYAHYREIELEYEKPYDVIEETVLARFNAQINFYGYEIPSLMQSSEFVSKRIEQIREGKVPFPEIAEAPYEHRREWAENPQMSGVVTIQPAVVLAISTAFAHMKAYVKWTSNKSVTMEFLQFDPVIQSQFAELVGTFLQEKNFDNPTGYLPKSVLTNAILKRKNITDRFNSNYSVVRTAPNGQFNIKGQLNPSRLFDFPFRYI